MTPIRALLAATGNTGWLPVDYKQDPFNLAAVVYISGTATASVYYTDSPVFNSTQYASLTQTTTTVTVTTSAKHGLTTADWVQILNSGSAAVDGLFQIASVGSDTTFTYTSGTSQTFTGKQGGTYTHYRTLPVTGLSAITASTASNIAFPVTAVLGVVSAYTSGAVDFNIVQSSQK